MSEIPPNNIFLMSFSCNFIGKSFGFFVNQSQKFSKIVEPCIKTAGFAIDFLKTVGIQQETTLILKSSLKKVKPFTNVLKGMRSLDWLVNERKGSFCILTLNVAGLGLLVFAIFDLIKAVGLSPLEKINQFFTKIPVFVALRYGGIPSILTIILLVSVIFLQKKGCEQANQHRKKFQGKIENKPESPKAARWEAKKERDQVALLKCREALIQKTIALASLLLTTTLLLTATATPLLMISAILFYAVDLTFTFHGLYLEKQLKTLEENLPPKLPRGSDSSQVELPHEERKESL